MTNKQRIKRLINLGDLKIPQVPKIQSFFTFPEKKRISDKVNIYIGNICGCIVVDKDEIKKQLIMHLNYLYEQGGNSLNISEQRIKGFIKSYDLKTDLSIFTYINSFQQIKPGAFINAVIRKVQKRNEEFFYQMCLNKPNLKFFKNIKLGVIKDDIQIPSSIMKVYQKQKTLPMNFQILYHKEFDNPGLVQKLIKNMVISQGYYVILSRIRIFQERRWAEQHYEKAIKEIENRNYSFALELLNIAKDFDTENIDILIGRSVALVNMKNFTQGLKQIKQALKLDPKNTQAKKIYEQIHSQMTKRQKPKLNPSLVFKKNQNNQIKKS